MPCTCKATEGWIECTQGNRDCGSPGHVCQRTAQGVDGPGHGQYPRSQVQWQPGGMGRFLADVEQVTQRLNHGVQPCSEAEVLPGHVTPLCPGEREKGARRLRGGRKISSWDEMTCAFRKEEVADPPDHAQRWFKAVLLRASGGHMRVPDWREFRREYRHLRQYVEVRGVESHPGLRHAAIQVAGEDPTGGAEARPVPDRGQGHHAAAAAPSLAAVDQLFGDRVVPV